MTDNRTTEFIIDLSEVEKTSDKFKMLFNETIPLGKRIVRCRDCRYFHDGTSNGRRYAEPHCLAIGELAYGVLFEVDEDCFCSWGERKEGEL